MKSPKSVAQMTGAVLTDLFGDLRDCVAGQIKDQKILKAGDEVWEFQ